MQDILQKVDVLVYNDSICAEGFFGFLNLEHHVCSGWPENGRGSCQVRSFIVSKRICMSKLTCIFQGDSGGALLVDGEFQIGIVSFGASGNCGISNVTYPKVLARVPSYIDFIQEHAGEVQLASDYIDDGSGDDEDEDEDEDGEDYDDEDAAVSIKIPSLLLSLLAIFHLVKAIL